MGIGKFFKNAWNGVKRGATKVWEGSKKVIPKVVDVIKRAPEYVDKAGRVLSLLPGKYGKIGDLISKGSNFIKPLINQLPDSKAKEKINEYYNKGENQVRDVYNKVKPWVNASGNIGNKVLDGQFA